MKGKLILAILLTVILGFGVRAYNLGDNPAGLFADEAAIGLHAYSLANTGKDYNGKPYPLSSESFGVWRNPVPIYFSIPFVKTLGLNEFAVRLAPAVAGTLSILILATLAYNLRFFDESSLGNHLFTFFSALFLAISPWHIHFSRFGAEYIYFPFLLSMGLALFLYAIRKPKFLPVAFALFALTLYTYYPAWLVVPLLLLGIYTFYRKNLYANLNWFLLGALFFILLSIPLINGITNKGWLARWDRVKTTDNLSNTVRSYFAHFSPDFLFSKGDIDYPGHFITRFSSRGTGEMYLFQFPLLIVGSAYLLLKTSNTPGAKAILWLLLLYPLGGSLANSDGGGPIAWRSIAGILPLNIIAAAGAAWIMSLLLAKTATSYVVLPTLGVIVVYSVLTHLAHYHIEYPKYSSDFWGWQYGPREIMWYFLKHKSRYDDLIIVGNFNSPEIFLRFYDPKNTCRDRCKIGNLQNFDPQRRQIFAVGTDRLQEIPGHLTLDQREVVYYPNRQPAFIIGELKGRHL